MKRTAAIIGLLVGLYFASGFYIVKGNEKALVRRFGKARLPLVASGLHYDLPWPMSAVDRINPNEVRTIKIEQLDLEGDLFLLVDNQFSLTEFLTGDKNILNLHVTVQYRISEANAADYLFHSESAEEHLTFIVENAITDAVARSGVDFVHPLGLAELRAILTAQTRRQADEHRLGLSVEDVTIQSVYPPIRVKQAFLEVSDARASKDRYINEALAYQVQTFEAARADARQRSDLALTYKQQTTESARGSADRFRKVVAQFHALSSNSEEYAFARNLALQRMYLDVLEEVLPKLEGKVFLDSGKPVDLTIIRDAKE